MNELTRHTEMLAFLRELAGQKVSKPDHWTECHQCERNIERAQELLETLSDDEVSK
jgi:hypothetical protein